LSSRGGLVSGQVSRFGGDGAEIEDEGRLTGGSRFRRWCLDRERWQAGIGQLGAVHDVAACTPGQEVSGHRRPDRGCGPEAARGPPARSARRGHRRAGTRSGAWRHAVAEGTDHGSLVKGFKEVEDDSEMPGRGASEGRRDGVAAGARQRMHEPETPLDRASDDDVVALVGRVLGRGDG